jgi:hypothetical protein
MTSLRDDKPADDSGDQLVPIMRSMSMHHPQPDDDYDDDTDDEMPGLI